MLAKNDKWYDKMDFRITCNFLAILATLGVLIMNKWILVILHANCGNYWFL